MKKRTPLVSAGASSCIPAVCAASAAVPAAVLLSSSDPKWSVRSAAVSSGPAMLPSTPTRNSSPTRWARVRLSSTCVTHAPAGEPVVGESALGAAEGALAVPAAPGWACAAALAGLAVSAGTAGALDDAPLLLQPAIKAQATAIADAAADARHRLIARCT